MMKIDQFVLIRGLGRESGHWLDFPLELAKTFPNAEMHLEDLPGFGHRRSMAFPNSIKSTTDMIRADAERYLKGTRVLIAVSLGGMVAADWIFRYPDDFNAAILINTSFNGLSSPLERLRPEGVYSLANAALQKSPEAREKWILQLVSNHLSERERAHGAWSRIASDRPVQVSAFVKQLWAAAHFKTPRGRPDIPVLIVSSRQDRMVDPACSARIAERWRVPNIVHPSAGHDLALDDGPWLARTIFQWLESTWPKFGAHSQGPRT